MPYASSTIDFTSFERVARAIEKLPKKRGADSRPTEKPTVEDLPDLLGFFVAMGVLTQEQAQAILDAFNGAGTPTLPDLPSGAVSIYPAFTAYVASIETDSWLGDAFDWVVDHLTEIVEVVETVVGWFD